MHSQHPLFKSKSKGGCDGCTLSIHHINRKSRGNVQEDVMIVIEMESRGTVKGALSSWNLKEM